MDMAVDPKTSSNRSQPSQRDVRASDAVESVATVVIAVSKSVPDVVIGLSAAISIAEKIIELAQQVSHNKRRCHFVATRIKLVLDVLITTTLKEDHAGPQVQSLIRNLNELRDYLFDLQSWGLIKRLIMRFRITEDLDEMEKKLDDFRLNFVLAAAVSTVEQRRKQAKEDAQGANKADVSTLMTEVRNLHQDPDKIADAIGLRGSTFSAEGATELDTLLQEVHANPDIDPVLRTFVNTATETLQKRTGTSLQRRQPWFIHPRDLDVDYTAYLGQGAYGSVYKGTLKGNLIVAKMFKERQTLESRLQEIAVWRNLAHEHVLPFLGANIFARKPFALSPYCSHGNALDYLRRNPNKTVDKVCLLRDIAAGMAYLHQGKIIHGDLKASNVLIDASGRALVGDFGLAAKKVVFWGGGIAEEGTEIEAPKPESPMHIPTTGTLRWLPPEAWRGAEPSLNSDIYAFAMTALEILGAPEQVIPFGNVHDKQLGEMLKNGDRPERPKGAYGFNGADGVWTVVTLCWDEEIAIRPPFSQTSVLLSFLQESHPDVRRNISRFQQELNLMNSKLWPVLVDYASALMVQGVANWFDAGSSTSTKDQECVQDDISASLFVLGAAASTTTANRKLISDLIDFSKLRRILARQSTPDDVCVNVCKLVTRLVVPDEFQTSGTDIPRSIREKILAADLITLIIQLLVPKSDIGSRVLALIDELFSARFYISDQPEDTIEKAFIDVGLLDRVRAFLTLDADVKIIFAAIGVASHSMHIVNASNSQIVGKVCMDSARLFKHPDSDVKNEASKVFSVLKYSLDYNETERRPIGNAFCEALLEPEFGFLCLLRDADHSVNVAALGGISHIPAWALSEEQKEMITKASLECFPSMLADLSENNQFYALDALSKLARDEGAGVYDAILSSGCPEKLRVLLSSSDADHQVKILEKLVWCILDEEGVQLMATLVQSENDTVRSEAWSSLERTLRDYQVSPTLKASLTKTNFFNLTIKGLPTTQDLLERVISTLMDWDDLNSYTKCINDECSQIQVIALKQLLSMLSDGKHEEMRKACMKAKLLDTLVMTHLPDIHEYLEPLVSALMDWDDIQSYTKCINDDSKQIQIVALNQLVNILLAGGNRGLKEACMRTDFLDSLSRLLKSDDVDVVTTVSRVLSAAVSHRRRLSLKETMALVQAGFAQLLVPLLEHECDEISRNACQILACMAMGSEEDLDALVSADAFTALTKYISGPATTFQMTPFQVKKLIEQPRKESRRLGTTLLVRSIESRDDAALDAFASSEDQFNNMANDWASSSDADMQELARQLKDALESLD